MAIDTSAKMDISNDTGAGMTVVAVPGPDKVSNVMPTMTDCTIGMTIEATYRGSGHDDIVD